MADGIGRFAGRVEWVNPHAWIHMEVTNPDGTKDV
jgi:hypothetical protein